MHAEVIKGRAHWTARFHNKGKVTMTDKQLRGSKNDAVRAVKNHVTQVLRSCVGNTTANVSFTITQLDERTWKITWDSMSLL